MSYIKRVKYTISYLFGSLINYLILKQNSFNECYSSQKVDPCVVITHQLWVSSIYLASFISVKNSDIFRIIYNFKAMINYYIRKTFLCGS